MGRHTSFACKVGTAERLDHRDSPFPLGLDGQKTLERRRREGEHMNPDAVRVGRKLGGGCVLDPVKVVAVVLASAAAYGSQPARRWQTST